jgi:hypothetical protein
MEGRLDVQSNAHIANLTPSATSALTLDDDRRCAFIVRDRFITHEQIFHIFSYADVLINSPRRSRARGLIVSGRAGSGKTALADALLRRYPERRATNDTRVILPLARITMTGAKMASEIYVRTMEALGVPHADRYSGRDACREVVRFLQQSRLRGLIVDEVQDVMNRTPIQMRETLESIKYVMNETGISIIALGTEEAERAVSCDPHLRARFKTLSLPNWTVGPHLANFLAELERCLPLREPSHLASPPMMRILVSQTEGVLDGILTLVNNACCLAVERGMERINEALLREAEYEIPAFLGTLRSED